MKIKMTKDRQGWFWPDALTAGQVLEVPDDVGKYLIEVEAAVEVKPARRRKPAKDDG